MKNNSKLIYTIGIIFLLVGIYLSIFQKEPHFYTFFSVGAFLILFQYQKSNFKKPFFKNWKTKQYLLFFVLVIIISIIIDQIGLSLGYWEYQYQNFFDETLKYFFEWGVALIYFMLILVIGIDIFKKKLNKNFSVIFSLLIFVTLAGLFTEYINHFSNSWIILKMPLTNYKIKEFFIVFQTIGYWLIAIIPLIIYKFTEKLK